MNMGVCYKMNPRLDLYVSEDGRVFQEGNDFAPSSLNDKLRTSNRDSGNYKYFVLKGKPIVLKEGKDYLAVIKNKIKVIVS